MVATKLGAVPVKPSSSTSTALSQQMSDVQAHTAAALSDATSTALSQISDVQAHTAAALSDAHARLGSFSSHKKGGEASSKKRQKSVEGGSDVSSC